MQQVANEENLKISLVGSSGGHLTHLYIHIRIFVNELIMQKKCFHGKTGYLFRNSADFAEKMVYLLNNDELNRNMGEKAHEFVKENFDMNRIIPQYR